MPSPEQGSHFSTENSVYAEEFLTVGTKNGIRLRITEFFRLKNMFYQCIPDLCIPSIPLFLVR